MYTIPDLIQAFSFIGLCFSASLGHAVFYIFCTSDAVRGGGRVQKLVVPIPLPSPPLRSRAPSLPLEVGPLEAS